MTITPKMLAKWPALVQKIRKVAAAENLNFQQAANFVLMRWFHLHKA